MSKRNERYLHKVQGAVSEKQGKYYNDRKAPKVAVGTKSAKLVELDGVHGQEVTMKEKKQSSKTMPKQKLKTRHKQQQFPVLKKETKKEKLLCIKTRLLLLNCAHKWMQKTFGKVSPSKARQHYNRNLLKRSLQQWEDVWWNGRNEWKLNIRADYHNRFRMWLKVWRNWRSFMVLQKVKKTKLSIAKKKADHKLLTKFFANWKCYIGKRKMKKQFYHQAEEEGEIILKRMAFSRWKNSFKFKQELHAMEGQALHFWARNLFYKVWQLWLFRFTIALEEKHKIVFAVQLYHRRLAFRALRSLKLYHMQRKLKKLRLLSGVRFHHLNNVRRAFRTWKVAWNRKVELMQFEDTVRLKGNKTRKRRVFMHWKHYIILCLCKRQNEHKALHHFQVNLKIKCMKTLRKRVEIQNRTAQFNATARKVYKISLLRRVWMSWLRKCENREDLRQISLNTFVRNHYSKHLLRKMLNSWKCYCETRKLEKDKKLKADVTARRNLLPRIFIRWKLFISVVVTQRENEERAVEFRRECLLAKTFYRWLQEYRLVLDIQMLYRMAIISYDEKVKKEFFQIWAMKTRQRTKDNHLLERGQDHYRLQLKKKSFVTWREYIEQRNLSTVRLNMAVRLRNTKLMLICWDHWTQFVEKKRNKWKMVIKADWHFHREVLGKIVSAWKLYCNDVKRIKSFAEEKKSYHDKKTLRFLFECWRTNARYLKTSRENYHTSSRHWEIKTTRTAFLAWRVFTEDRLCKKQQDLCTIVEARKLLEREKLRRTLGLWKKEYGSRISFKGKWARACEHWKTCLQKKSIDVLKKYRFLGYRKQVLRRHCMFYHNYRILASHWKMWRSGHADRVAFSKKSRMALWMWSYTLQRKAFDSWFHYAEEKRKKKVAINEALERRRQWMHKVAVTRWIKFATFSIAKREKVAASRHVQLSQNVQRSVQKFALHWRRKTQRNRGKRRQVSYQHPPVSSRANLPSYKAISSEKRQSPIIVQNVPTVRRPQPRVPEYLRESFNLSELCDEHISFPAVTQTGNSEAVPRNLPSNFQPVTQPDRLPEPTVYASSITSLTSSSTSQTGHTGREVRPLGSNSRNPGEVSQKVVSSEKRVLLPPSSFTQNKPFVGNGPEKQFSEECMKKVREKEKDTKADESSSDEVQNGSQNVDPMPNAMPKFLSDKTSQQSIVQLRDRMLKYYTISTQLRSVRRRLTSLREWSRESKEKKKMLSEEELSVLKELMDELSENVTSTNHTLEQSYETIAKDLQGLLDKVS